MSDLPRNKFINELTGCVSDFLRGLVSSDEEITQLQHCDRVILRRDLNTLNTKGVVALISGGGSGHEPFAAGYVGKNALTAAICGDIFTSPPSKHILHAIEAVSAGSGIIVFIINYTGDRLNFGMAIERAKSFLHTSSPIQLIYVDDDVALEEQLAVKTGARGLAGAALVMHIAGVMADEKGMTFDAVGSHSRRVVENMATFGVSLYPCALPGRPEMFPLDGDEMELGLGIHGEPGRERMKVLKAADLVNLMLHNITSSQRFRSFNPCEEGVAVLLNNLGATSQLELGIVQGEVLKWLHGRGISAKCLMSGSVMTSLDGHGFSITLLRLVDEQWLDYLTTAKSPISAHWRLTIPPTEPTTTGLNLSVPLSNTLQENSRTMPSVTIYTEKAEMIKQCVRTACNTLHRNKDELNHLDAACGDGDCGTALGKAAIAILHAIEAAQLHFTRPAQLFTDLSHIFEEIVGGTSGAVYALFFGAASKAFSTSCEAEDFSRALQLGLSAVMVYGNARPGHRTLVDPLHAAAEMNSSDWEKIVEAAERGAMATASMIAKSGRASYTARGRQNQPDPGAMGVALWMRAAYDEYKALTNKA